MVAFKHYLKSACNVKYILSNLEGSVLFAYISKLLKPCTLVYVDKIEDLPYNVNSLITNTYVFAGMHIPKVDSNNNFIFIVHIDTWYNDNYYKLNSNEEEQILNDLGLHKKLVHRIKVSSIVYEFAPTSCSKHLEFICSKYNHYYYVENLWSKLPLDLRNTYNMRYNELLNLFKGRDIAGVYKPLFLFIFSIIKIHKLFLEVAYI